MQNNKDKDKKLVSISLKGATFIMISIGIINIILVKSLERLGIREEISIVILNSLISSGIVSYVITFIDDNTPTKEKFLSRYIKFALLFGFISYFWTRGAFI